MITDDTVHRKGESGMEGKILTAAEKLFIEKGYERTSTTDIAKMAGCNQALVHYYFRTKEKLFNAILGSSIRDIFRQFFILETGEGTFEEKLTRLIGMHFDLIRKNSGVVLFLINEFTRDPGQFDSLVSGLGDTPSKTLAAMNNDLQKEIRERRIRQIEIRELILNVISLNVFLFAIKPVFARVWNMDENDMEQMLDRRKKEVTETIIRSLRP